MKTTTKGQRRETEVRRRRKMPWRALFAAALLGTGIAQAQVAITEAMSFARNVPVVGDDFWELTNFGQDPVNLDDYWFRDDGGISGAANLGGLWTQSRTDPPIIMPGESVLFFRRRSNQIDLPEEFRAWWGLTDGVKVAFYDGYGFDNIADSVNLWKIAQGRTHLVQHVDLFESLQGRTFTYDPETGLLDRFSEAGIDGAFVAAGSTDVGSPGQHLGPVPLRFVVPPRNTAIDGGSPVTFTARAHGLPAPQYQWRFNGEIINGATQPSFHLAAATPDDAGVYTVEIHNGIETTTSAPAQLSVNTNPACASLVRAPSDAIVTEGHSAVFRIETRGYPVAAIQWSFAGSPIPGATSATLTVPAVDAGRAGLYSVTVSNALCRTNATARLRIIPEDNLWITEVMAGPTNKIDMGHDSWWELTNFGTNIVNLRGYKWDDKPPSFERSLEITNDLFLAPGRSAIFVTDMAPQAFRRWWGDTNLPADLIIIPHHGNGLNPVDDQIRLWNPSALRNDEWLLDLGFVNDQAGISLWFDPGDPSSEFGIPSVIGERGAFRAAESEDIGSPGWTSNELRVTAIRTEINGIRVTWKTQRGRTYELRSRDTPTGTSWSLLARVVAAGESTTALDTTPGTTRQRFYQILLVPQP